MIIIKNMKKIPKGSMWKILKSFWRRKRKKKTWERYHNITEEEKKAITTKAKACWV